MYVYWKDCFGRNQWIGTAGTVYSVCGSTPSSTTPGVGIVTGGACTNNPGTPLDKICPP